jgi:hypothetical protein
LDFGGKSDATPLWQGRPATQKAVSSLRSATALQNAGARNSRVF